MTAPSVASKSPPPDPGHMAACLAALRECARGLREGKQTLFAAGSRQVVEHLVIHLGGAAVQGRNRREGHERRKGYLVDALGQPWQGRVDELYAVAQNDSYRDREGPPYSLEQAKRAFAIACDIVERLGNRLPPDLRAATKFTLEAIEDPLTIYDTIALLESLVYQGRYPSDVDAVLLKTYRWCRASTSTDDRKLLGRIVSLLAAREHHLALGSTTGRLHWINMAIKLNRRLEEPGRLFRAVRSKGIVQRWRKEYDHAFESIALAIQLAEGKPREMHEALEMKAVALSEVGRFDEAIKIAQTLRAEAECAGDRAWVARRQMSEGICEYYSGDRGRAGEWFERCRDTLILDGHVVLASSVRMWLMKTHLNAGELDSARGYAKQLLSFAAKYGIGGYEHQAQKVLEITAA